MKTRVASETKQHILDVAEQHFADYGFAGTSLRGIIKDAEVNIAAVAYHFGTKEDLFTAVVERFAAPVVTEQLARLESLSDPSDLQAVLQAFYAPPLKAVKTKGRKGQTLGLFLGRMQTEPDPIFSLVDMHFAFCRERFIEAFRKCLPAATEADLQWNFEFMLSLIVTFLTRQNQIRKRYSAASDPGSDEPVERMTRFCLSGMQTDGL